MPQLRKYIDEAIDSNVLSLNHRTPEFEAVFAFATEQVKKLLNIPDGFHVFFPGSATESMDRIVQNLSGERSCHFVNGSFSERFYNMAVELGRKAQKIEVPAGKGFDFEKVKIENDPEVICFTQNETSTGVQTLMKDIYATKEKFPNTMIAIDIVSSAPYVNIDYNKIDCAFFSVQKGFGMPAGLGVLIVNEKCMERARHLRKKGFSIGSYHNFISLYDNAIKNQTTETPNMLGLYLLGKVAEDLNKYGIDQIRKDTDEKAKLIYDHFEDHPHFKLFVKNKDVRSKTVATIVVEDRQKEVKKKLADNGIVVGSGYGKEKDTHIRIANFPVHKIEDVKRIIEII